MPLPNSIRTVHAVSTLWDAVPNNHRDYNVDCVVIGVEYGFRHVSTPLSVAAETFRNGRSVRALVPVLAVLRACTHTHTHTHTHIMDAYRCEPPTR